MSYDPDLYYNPDALPIRLEQPLQMPAPVTTREAHDAETDPLLRMAPGYERYKRISLLYETSLTDTFRQVGPEDGGDEGRKSSSCIWRVNAGNPPSRRKMPSVLP